MMVNYNANVVSFPFEFIIMAFSLIIFNSIQFKFIKEKRGNPSAI